MSEMNELAFFIRSKRKLVCNTSREFWEKYQTKLCVEEAAYRNYESGNRFPDIGFLQRIAPLIRVEVKTLCHLWARSKMPSPETKDFFPGIPEYSPTHTARALPHEIYRFNRTDIKLLKKHTELFAIASFLAAYFDSDPVSVSEIAEAANITKQEAYKQLSVLDEMGIVFSTSKDHYKCKYKDCEVPRDDEFFTEVRNNNFRLLSGLVLKSYSVKKREQNLAQRFTFTFRPSEEALKRIQNKFSEIEAILDSIPDKGDKVYTMGVVLSDVMERKPTTGKKE